MLVKHQEKKMATGRLTFKLAATTIKILFQMTPEQKEKEIGKKYQEDFSSIIRYIEWTNVINQSRSFSLQDYETFSQLLEDKKLPFLPFHISLNDRRAVDGDCNIEMMGQIGDPGVKHKTIPYMVNTDTAGSSMVINHSKGTSWSGSSFLINQFSCMRYTQEKCQVSSDPCKPEGGRKPQNQGAIRIEFSAPP